MKKKYALFIDPYSNKEDYVVVAIYSLYKRLAFIKAGDKSWRHGKSHNVEMRGGISLPNSISDITFYEGLIYVVTHRGLILCFNAKDGYCIRRSKVKIVAPKMDPPTYSKRAYAYLVESSNGGELFYVQRNLDHTLQHTTHFKVYKLRLDEQCGEVMDRIEVKSLGDGTFFVAVGTNYSMSVSVSAAEKFSGCQPNSISHMTILTLVYSVSLCKIFFSLKKKNL